MGVLFIQGHTRAETTFQGLPGPQAVTSLCNSGPVGRERERSKPKIPEIPFAHLTFSSF